MMNDAERKQASGNGSPAAHLAAMQTDSTSLQAWDASIGEADIWTVDEFMEPKALAAFLGSAAHMAIEKNAM